jgi:hypothetical protein
MLIWPVVGVRCLVSRVQAKWANISWSVAVLATRGAPDVPNRQQMDAVRPSQAIVGMRPVASGPRSLATRHRSWGGANDEDRAVSLPFIQNAVTETHCRPGHQPNERVTDAGRFSDGQMGNPVESRRLGDTYAADQHIHSQTHFRLIANTTLHYSEKYPSCVYAGASKSARIPLD